MSTEFSEFFFPHERLDVYRVAREFEAATRMILGPLPRVFARCEHLTP